MSTDPIEAPAPARHTHDHARTMRDLEAAFGMLGQLLLRVSDAELEVSLEAVSQADAIGFVIDPTAYRQALGDRRLDRQRKLLQLARTTLREMTELWPDVGELRSRVHPAGPRS
jgi:hypothetical protein